MHCAKKKKRRYLPVGLGSPECFGILAQYEAGIAPFVSFSIASASSRLRRLSPRQTRFRLVSSTPSCSATWRRVFPDLSIHPTRGVDFLERARPIGSMLSRGPRPSTSRGSAAELVHRALKCAKAVVHDAYLPLN